MDRLLLALVLGAFAIGLAVVVQRRKVAGPTNAAVDYAAPRRLDREDFERPEAPWLVAVFTSSTCGTCADVWEKARVLASDQVCVQQIDEHKHSALHKLYGVAAVPIVAIADAGGEVEASFLGPVSATHLWAAIAELRDPGTVPPECSA